MKTAGKQRAKSSDQLKKSGTRKQDSLPADLLALPVDELSKKILEKREAVVAADKDISLVSHEISFLQRMLRAIQEENKILESEICSVQKEKAAGIEAHGACMKAHDQRRKAMKYEFEAILAEASSEEARAKQLVAAESARQSSVMDERRAAVDKEEKRVHSNTDHGASVEGLKREYEAALKIKSAEYDSQLEALDERLSLELNVRVQEAEECKKAHLNRLVTEHAKCIESVKKYYKEVCSDNLSAIGSLKASVEALKSQLKANQVRIAALTNSYVAGVLIEGAESGPAMANALAEKKGTLSRLREQLKSLKHNMTMLKSLEEGNAKLEKRIADLRKVISYKGEKHARINEEVSGMLKSHQQSLDVIHKKCELKNQLLESRLKELSMSLPRSAVASPALENGSAKDDGKSGDKNPLEGDKNRLGGDKDSATQAQTASLGQADPKAPTLPLAIPETANSAAAETAGFVIGDAEARLEETIRAYTSLTEYMRSKRLQKAEAGSEGASESRDTQPGVKEKLPSAIAQLPLANAHPSVEAPREAAPKETSPPATP